nr:ABC-type transport auxiliary lipoprotein family protein [Pseudomonadota bacterium]
MTIHRLSLLLAVALVAGCSTPPDHFHTLRPAVAPSSAREAPRLLAIGPVTVPDSLARDEWVIRTGDTGAMVYDHQLWTQGLGADVAQSLVDYLNRGPLPDGLW